MRLLDSAEHHPDPRSWAEYQALGRKASDFK
jgi:hypothetical protein